MRPTRRELLGALAASGSAAPVSLRARPRPLAAPKALRGTLQRRVQAHFEGLPGTQALKIWAPATRTHAEFLIAMNASQRLFVGSAIKAFVLCERMRQLDGPDILTKLTSNQVVLDEQVWSVDSATFNPPNLAGTVSERTAMEAMILHSDNTATDMELKQTGPDKVRAFLAGAGLRRSAVPDSTRSFFGYLLGAGDYKAFTWAQLVAAADKPIVNLPLNDVETLASSADDFVSFYQRSIQGEFFHHPQTLQQYRDVLSLGDVVNLVLPLGGSAFAKGGSIDVPGFHALCVAGAAYLANRWIYFAAIINWQAAAASDPATVALYLAAARSAFAELYEGLR